MGPIKQVEYQGKKVQGRSVEFEAKGEHWNHYSLEDGSTLKLKVVLLDVVRLEGVYNNGNPVYQFAAQQIIGIDAPEELKEKTQ